LSGEHATKERGSGQNTFEGHLFDFDLERSEGQAASSTDPDTRTIFESLLKGVIKDNTGLPIALPELLIRARIRFLRLTFDWWDSIFWDMSSTLDGIDASMSIDSVVSEKLSEWRRLWCNWRGLLTEFQTTRQQTCSWIDKVKAKSEKDFNSDGLSQLDIGLSALKVEHKKLEGRIEASFQALMSTMAIIDSRHAIAEAESVSKLTELAFVFIPLSFATSFFGMNMTVSH
jgi:hypothetical protein